MDNSSQPSADAADKPIRRPKVTQRQPGTGRFVKSVDGDERRRLSALMKSRGATWQTVADKHWGGDRGTALREVKRWYAKNPSEDTLTQRRIVTEGLEGLEEVVRGVMARTHYVVGQRGVVLDAKGEPLVDDQPIYQGVDRILKIKEMQGKFTPGLLAPKLTAEVPMDLLESEIAAARAAVAAEMAALEEEGGDDDEA